MIRLWIFLFLLLSACAKVPGTSAGAAANCDPYLDLLQYTYPDGVTRKSTAKYCVSNNKACTTYQYVNDPQIKYKECQEWTIH